MGQEEEEEEEDYCGRNSKCFCALCISKSCEMKLCSAISCMSCCANLGYTLNWKGRFIYYKYVLYMNCIARRRDFLQPLLHFTYTELFLEWFSNVFSKSIYHPVQF